MARSCVPVLIATLWLAGSLSAVTAAPPPNVVLVMTDDQGYGDLGCHGNQMIQTPNLDRLYGQSLHLTDFHVDPTCAPTRSALMTGRYSSRTGVWHTIMGRSILRRDEVTIADVFAANGYRTAHFGKWHLGDNYPSRPGDHGFHEVIHHGGGGVTQTPDYWGNDYFDDTYWHNEQTQAYTGYCTDVFFEAALAFIEANKDRPFLVYLPTNAPHGPYFVADKYKQPYLDKGVAPTMAAFYGMIANIDENMGRLLAKLDELKLAENTVLIFMTDNGTAAGLARARRKGKARQQSKWPGFNAGMRGTKGSEYDGGHRVPCFVRWPAGGVQGGRDVPQLAAHIDILPTLVDLCGLQWPKTHPKIDGASLVPLLKGKSDWPARTLLVHSQRIEHPEKWRKSAVMTDRWRLINGKELYDIQADPGQKKDLAGQSPAVVAKLRQEYERWWQSISVRFDEYCEIVIGSEHENPSRITCHDWHGPIVPWNQGMIKRAPEANGFWAIDVARAGKYHFTLRQQPAEANFAIDATNARLSIAGVDVTKPVPAGATSISFAIDLPAGKTKLQTWLTNKAGKSRGAYFIQAERVD